MNSCGSAERKPINLITDTVVFGLCDSIEQVPSQSLSYKVLNIKWTNHQLSKKHTPSIINITNIKYVACA